MYFDAQTAVDIFRTQEPRVTKSARRAWRFRHLKSKEAKVATAVLTSVLNLFIR